MRPLATVFGCAGGLLLAAGMTQAQTVRVTNPMNTLMPQPSEIAWQQGSTVVSPSFTVGFPASHDDRLEAATRRMLDRLESLSGAQLNKKAVADAAAATMTIDAQGAGEKVQSIDEDESYSLVIDSQHVKLQAATDVGAMRGMETLLQLAQLRSGQYVLPAVTIHDSPRFRWRGLMLDCGRHFYPVPVILRTLDGMAAVKLNVFHWHLSEDQGFRVESKLFPKLQGMGSNGLYYTQEQVKEVVAYARERGIRVVPEFDMPGHTTSWFVGYPELASGPATGGGAYQVQTRFGVHDGAIDPTRESTYKFLDAFIGEMAGLFPDPYMHIGGDESNGEQWKANPKIVAFMKQKNLSDTAALQAYFNQQLLKILTRHGKRMVGWDEVLNPDLPKDVVVQSWRGVDSLAAGARAGYQGILSAPYYLDGMKTSEEHYLADPMPQGLSAEQGSLVLGGEVCMWSEQVSPLTVDSRIWPRTAAMAERFWSPAGVRDVNDMYRRLRVESLRLDGLGLTQISGPQRALRGLAGEREPAALTELASVIEPVSFGDRYQGQHTDQLTPLDRLVDAVVPDPQSRHDMELRVDLFLGDAPRFETQRNQLEEDFRAWRDLPISLEYMVDDSPRLADAAPRVRQLSELGQIGLEAVFYLSHHVPPPVGWQARSETVISEAEKPAGLVRFTFLVPMRKLVEAASRM